MTSDPKRPRITWADRLVLYVVAGAGLVLLFLPGTAGEPGGFRITGEGGYEALLPADAREVVEVPGPLGPTVVEIGDGRARVTSSPCPHGTCVSMGPAEHPGQSVVCVPNRVVVTVTGEPALTGGRPARPDAVTR